MRNVATVLSGVVVAMCARDSVWGGAVAVRGFVGAVGDHGFFWGVTPCMR